MNTGHMSLFALDPDRDLGQRMARVLGLSLSAHEERDFEDGEHKIRPLESVRGRDVFVVQSLYGDGQRSVNDKLCRLLFFLGTLRDASAARVTAVLPYLCYARKDRRTKPRDPVTTRYVAALFEAVGVDRVVTLDVHNLAAYQNAFRCPADHLEARGLFARWLLPRLGERELVVVSPDSGGMKRVDRFKETLEPLLGRAVPTAFMEKQRSEGKVSGKALVGEVRGRVALILDDLISSGTTLARAARACREQGATEVHAACTHGVFVGGASEVLADEALDGVVITDTIPPFRLGEELLASKVRVLDTSTLFARAVERIHTGGSVVELVEE